MADSRVLVDTSVFIDFLRKDKKDQTIFWYLQENYSCTMSSVTLFELLCGAKTEKHLADVNTLKKWIDSLPFNDAVAETAATIFRELKTQNKLIEFRDIFIAATAYEHDLPVATLNRKHFENIMQITLIDLKNHLEKAIFINLLSERQRMNITHRPPRAAALTVFSALQSAVTKTLDKKQRLGHYAVIWKNGEVIEKHFDESKSNADFQTFLLDSPEMSDEEFQAIQEKRTAITKLFGKLYPDTDD